MSDPFLPAQGPIPAWDADSVSPGYDPDDQSEPDVLPGGESDEEESPSGDGEPPVRPTVFSTPTGERVDPASDA